MKSLFNKMDNDKRPINILRDKKARDTFIAAVVGGGRDCYNLLKLMDEGRSSRLNIRILGVSDINPDAPGLKLAKKLKLFTTKNLTELFTLRGLNLIIDLTDSSETLEEIYRLKPSEVSVIDYRAASLLWDLVRMEVEMEELDRKWGRHLDLIRKQSQVIPDSLPYRIMVVNMDKTVETVNKTFLNAFGLTEDMIRGKKCYELKYGFKRPCMEEKHTCYIDDQLDEIKEKGIFSTYEKLLDENGQTRFEVITLAPIFDEKGEVFQILEASRDVTERIKLEDEAQKSNTFLQNVIQSTVDGIVVVDTKGNVLIFNEGMERLTGFSANEIINRGHLSAFYDINLARENMKKMRSDQFGPEGKLNPTSMTISTKEGVEIPVTLSASIITIDNQEVGSVGVFTDMREFLKMRKELEQAHLQLVQSEKIASVGRMAAGVAHEVNNPLSGIMIYAELIKESLKEDSNLLNDIQEIIDQTLRCKKIVSELLEFSRQSVGNVSSFTFEELIDKSLNILINQALFQDIDVIKKIEKDLPSIVGDIGQLQQVFTNLFINAADAMERKGRIVLEAKYDKAGDQLIIKVSDTGPGVPEELRDKIFDIFFTTKQVGKGTGLGLSISQNIIQLHGGNIAMTCPPEGGTEFIIELPIGFVEHPIEKPVFI
ncbi:MAG: PAS domain S-box protein [Deltaproteobacteria bacterium]|nr:PAS domain S-box protein [Deltaproteobacteria bacterium]